MSTPGGAAIGIGCPSCGALDLYPSVDRYGRRYEACAHCPFKRPAPALDVAPLVTAPPTFSLRKLAATQNRVNEVWRDRSLVAPAFTTEQLAVISYALGALSAERLAAGERLDDLEPESSNEAGL